MQNAVVCKEWRRAREAELVVKEWERAVVKKREKEKKAKFQKNAQLIMQWVDYQELIEIYSFHIR